jgi:hypothetical protein
MATAGHGAKPGMPAPARVPTGFDRAPRRRERPATLSDACARCGAAGGSAASSPGSPTIRSPRSPGRTSACVARGSGAGSDAPLGPRSANRQAARIQPSYAASPAYRRVPAHVPTRESAWSNWPAATLPARAWLPAWPARIRRRWRGSAAAGTARRRGHRSGAARASLAHAVNGHRRQFGIGRRASRPDGRGRRQEPRRRAAAGIGQPDLPIDDQAREQV